ARAIAVAVEFLDLQLQMGDQCLVVGLPSTGGRSLRASNDQCRFQRFDVVWQRFKAVTHGPDGITKAAIRGVFSPAPQNIFEPSLRSVAATCAQGCASRSPPAGS